MMSHSADPPSKKKHGENFPRITTNAELRRTLLISLLQMSIDNHDNVKTCNSVPHRIRILPCFNAFCGDSLFEQFVVRTAQDKRRGLKRTWHNIRIRDCDRYIGVDICQTLHPIHTRMKFADTKEKRPIAYDLADCTVHCCLLPCALSAPNKHSKHQQPRLNSVFRGSTVLHQSNHQLSFYSRILRKGF